MKARWHGQLVGRLHRQLAALTAGLLWVGMLAAILIVGARVAAFKRQRRQRAAPFRRQEHHRYSYGDDQTGQEDHHFTLRERDTAVNAECEDEGA